MWCSSKTRLTLLCGLAVGAVAIGAAPAASGERRAVGLDELIALAARSARARMAAAATDAARGQLREANGQRFPKFTSTVAGAPSPDIQCLNPECTVTSSRDVTLAFSGVAGRVEADLVQPLYTFGKLDAVRAAARAGVAASARLEDAAVADMAVEAARAYYGVLLARELQWMLEDGQEQIAKARATLEQKLAEGSADVTLQDRFRVEALAAEVDARLVDARQGEDIALAGVHAVAEAADLVLADEYLEPLELELEAVDTYVHLALERRPEVEAASAGAEAARELAALETARWLPDVVLVAGVRVARAQGADDPPSAFANDPLNRTTAAVALAMRWTFDPVAQSGRVRRTEAKARQADALADAARVGAVHDARTAYAQAARAGERIDVSRRGEKSARGWLASTLQNDAIGTVDAKDLADAYVAYFEAHARLLSAMYDWNVAVVRLRRASGEYRRPEARLSR